MGPALSTGRETGSGALVRDRPQSLEENTAKWGDVGSTRDLGPGAPLPAPRSGGWVSVPSLVGSEGTRGQKWLPAAGSDLAEEVSTHTGMCPHPPTGMSTRVRAHTHTHTHTHTRPRARWGRGAAGGLLI